MIKVRVSDEISSVCPTFVGACVDAMVVNTPYNDRLWNAIHEVEQRLRGELTFESVKALPSIAATRAVYKLCGKDPSRYRPASEQLIRRMLQGKELYQIDTLVDLVNLASIAYGYSIGGFDADKFVGDELVLGVGKEGEPYEGIGRGPLNIAGLPVYRDAQGGVGWNHPSGSIDKWLRRLQGARHSQCRIYTEPARGLCSERWWNCDYLLISLIVDGYASAKTLPSSRVICSFVYSEWKSFFRRSR